jgi:hypothetical protein
VNAVHATAGGLAACWLTALGIASSAGGMAVIALMDREVEVFAPVVVTMAGIYLVVYALGRPRTAWLGLAALSVVVSVLLGLDAAQLLPVDPAVRMTLVAVLVWLWTVVRGRFADGPTFTTQTAGMVGFGAVTLVCAAIAPGWALVLAGAGFLAHGTWDVYTFVDILVGPALIVAGIV